MTPGRPRWWTELPLILVVYAAYSGARLLARGDTGTAVENGVAILRLERALLLNAEEPLNDLFTQQAAFGVPASFVYAALHYLVTPVVLVWLFRCHPLRYRLMRTWLMVSTLLGLVGFTLLPTAPPRLLDPGYGFVDSLAQYSSYGWWSDAASAPSGLGDMTNQYAAMPSLHVGWALWCGVALWRHGRPSPPLRAAAVGYPLVTTVVVMGTANHYLLDVLGGVLVMGAGWLLARPAARLVDRLRPRTAAAAWLPAQRRDGSAAAGADGGGTGSHGVGTAGDAAVRSAADGTSRGAPVRAAAGHNGAAAHRADGPGGRDRPAVPSGGGGASPGGGSS